MAYNPRPEQAALLERALAYINSVDYTVTARWVFYRLLQDGLFTEKADYKRLLSYLSKARKSFYAGWTPWTLADDTRTPILMERRGTYELFMRSGGFPTPEAWLETVKRELNCVLDRWADQDQYTEIWFEAAAMQGQFLFHANENIPLLAFHGDVSIPAKWAATMRLARRWLQRQRPINVLYYGDLDEKGIQIPEAAEKDIYRFAAQALYEAEKNQVPSDYSVDEFLDNFSFKRMGLTQEQVDQYGVPENPERPGTYQWEGVDDGAAAEMIGLSDDYLDLEAFEATVAVEDGITHQFRNHLDYLELDEDEATS